MTNLFEYLLLEGKTIKDFGINTDILERFIKEWIISEDEYAIGGKSESAMDAYNELADVLRPKVRKYKDVIKAIHLYCKDILSKLDECGLYNVTQEVMNVLTKHISEMSANTLEFILQNDSEGILVELHDKLVKCFYGEKIPKEQLNFYKACKSGKYQVLPKIFRIGKGYVEIEKLKLCTEKCNNYQYTIDRLYYDFKDHNYDLEEYNEEEQEVLKWLEQVEKAIQESTNTPLIAINEQNIGEREDGSIVYFNI